MTRPESTSPFLSVVIPTYNRQERLRRVIGALAEQVVDVPFEVVVVSDGSTDGTNELLASGALPMPVVAATQPNSGPAAARNRGVELASGEVVLFIDDDVVPDPGLLARHVGWHQAAATDRVVIGPMLTPDDVRLAPWVAWEQRMLYKQYDAMVAGEWAPTFRQFYTGNASVRRDRIVAAGGFDVRFKRAEDVELAYRLHLAGVEFVYDHEAAAHHYADRSFESWRNMARSYGENDVAFARGGQSWLLGTMSQEFGTRHRLVRSLVRACVPRPRLAAVATAALERIARISGRVGPQAVAHQALSAVYGLTYFQGVADALGSPDRLLTLLRTGDVDLEASAPARRVLLTVSGTIPEHVVDDVASGRRPRVDYLELAAAFDADLADHASCTDSGTIGRVLGRALGANARLAWACWRARRSYDVIVTDGEQVGLPLAAMLWWSRRRSRARHVMIVHIMSRRNKALLFRLLRLGRHIDDLLVYSSAQQRFIVEQLHVAPAKVTVTPFMVDTAFFAPDAVVPSRDERVICAAGLEFRDYATMLVAVDGLPAPVVLAAASPWSKRSDGLDGIDIPTNTTVVRLDLHALRQLYADAALVVMPLLESEFQAGITTILEGMSMGKPVVCTRTTGQTDTIIDGVNGRYVPVGDAASMRAAIEQLLDHPAGAEALGAAAREWVLEHADIEVYASRLAGIVDAHRSTRTRRPAVAGVRMRP